MQNTSFTPTIDQALTLHQQGQWEAARAIYEALLARLPQDFDALHLLGVLEHQAKNSVRAIELMTQAAALNPQHADVYFNLGVAQAQAKQLDAAIQSYDAAIANRADHDKAWVNRGMAWLAMGQLDRALASLDGALAIRSNAASTHTNRGVVLKALGQFEAAMASFDQAIACQPDYAQAYVNKGHVLRVLGRFQDAVSCYDQAIALNPRSIDAYSGRGVALKEQLLLPQALSSYDQALAIQPQSVEVNWNKSLDLLLSGDFAQGWPLHEWRWHRAEAASSVRGFTQPLWLGQAPLLNQRILLHAEQGFGDTLQFCRYVKDVARLGAHVVLEVPSALMGLMRSLDGVAELVECGHVLPLFDYHCPLMSLPLALQVDAPADTGPYLCASPDKLAHWHARLAQVRSPRVGVVWSGNPNHNNDQQRSVGLAQLLACVPAQVQAISLQPEVRAEDAAVLRDNPHVLHFGDELHDFEDTAALCAQMDLVISVDTSVAHLACALGKPTWLLLPFCPDWRWQLHRRDSPWYSSARLYRQRQWGDWSNVWEEIHKDLSLQKSF